MDFILHPRTSRRDASDDCGNKCDSIMADRVSTIDAEKDGIHTTLASPIYMVLLPSTWSEEMGTIRRLRRRQIWQTVYADGALIFVLGVRRQTLSFHVEIYTL